MFVPTAPAALIEVDGVTGAAREGTERETVRRR